MYYVPFCQPYGNTKCDINIYSYVIKLKSYLGSEKVSVTSVQRVCDELMRFFVVTRQVHPLFFYWHANELTTPSPDGQCIRVIFEHEYYHSFEPVLTGTRNNLSLSLQHKHCLILSLEYFVLGSVYSPQVVWIFLWTVYASIYARSHRYT